MQSAVLLLSLVAGASALGLRAGIVDANADYQSESNGDFPLAEDKKIREFTDSEGVKWKKATTTRYWDCSFQHCSNYVEKTTEGRWQCPNPQWHDQETPACNKEGSQGAMCADVGLGLFEHRGELYGTAAASSTLGIGANAKESGGCGKCYQTKVNKGARQNKTLTLMVTNWCPECHEGKAPLGRASGHWHFDIAVPGGGQGKAPSCLRQHPDTPEKDWETVPPFHEPKHTLFPAKPVWSIDEGKWTQGKQDEADQKNQHAWKVRKEHIQKIYTDARAQRTKQAMENCMKLPNTRYQDSCKLWYETFGDENLEVDFREISCPSMLFSRMCLFGR